MSIINVWLTLNKFVISINVEKFCSSFMTPLPQDWKTDFREELSLTIVEIMGLGTKLRLKLREFERFEKKIERELRWLTKLNLK